MTLYVDDTGKVKGYSGSTIEFTDIIASDIGVGA